MCGAQCFERLQGLGFDQRFKLGFGALRAHAEQECRVWDVEVYSRGLLGFSSGLGGQKVELAACKLLIANRCFAKGPIRIPMRTTQIKGRSSNIRGLR